MSLRNKFLVSYIALLAVVSISAVATIWAAGRWRTVTDEQSRTYAQVVAAERLRWDITRLSNANRGLLTGDAPAPGDFVELAGRVQKRLDDLREGARLSPDSALVLDLIGGFEEAYRELLWVSEQVQILRATDAGSIDHSRWNVRLTDIDDEVADAAAVLQQYSRTRNESFLEAAERAGDLTGLVSGIAVSIAVVLVVAMIFLLHRWVTRPVADLEVAADAIGAGALDLNLPYHGEREWQKVAQALHHMTRSLKMTQQQLATSERLGALGEVAAYVAHNIRNPVASIRAMSQAALLDPDISPDHRQSFADTINCCDKIETWVARLLGWARPMTLMPEACDLNSVVRETCEIFATVIIKKQIELIFAPAPSLPTVNLDTPLFEQALSAIIANSVDATPRDGQVRVATRAIDADGPAEWVVVTVEETGPGIPPDLLPDVFKPFVSGKEEGSGLGLAQAKKIIDLHVGRIDIASADGRGTTVTITLPATLDEVHDGEHSDNR